MTFSPTFGRFFSPTFQPNSVKKATVAISNFFNQLYSGTRNNFTGTVGFVFKPTRNITVVALGRAVSTSIANDHIVKIWSETPTEICAVTITSLSPVDALGYAYEMLASPITLTSGTKYRIASNEANGGDKWMDLNTISNHLSSADILSACYLVGSYGYPSSTYGTTNQGYVPTTFYE